MLEIHNSATAEEEDEDDEAWSGDFGPQCRVFVAKVPICAIAKRFQELIPSERSWPVLEWQTIMSPSPNQFNYWYRIDAVLKFVYQGSFDTGGPESYFNTTDSDIITWCLGNSFKCPKLQNFALKAVMKRDAATEESMKECGEDENYILRSIAADSAYLMENIGVIHKAEGEFHPHKLISYMMDRLVWDALNGGYQYLTIIHGGNCIANMVARAQVSTFIYLFCPVLGPESQGILCQVLRLDK